MYKRQDDLCTLLSNQDALVRHSLPLRLALVQHTVAKLLPLPLPRDPSPALSERSDDSSLFPGLPDGAPPRAIPRAILGAIR